MKITIGIEDRGLTLGPLITNRTHDAMRHGCIVRVSEIDGTDGRMADVIVSDCERSFEKEYSTLCVILADIIVENLQIRHLVRLLKRDHQYLSEKEQCDILVRALKKLWYGIDGHQGNVALCKNDVRHRLCDIIYETEADTMILEGFMRFRMKDYLDTWATELSSCVTDYVRKKEYAEFVEILRLFINVRIPRTRKVHIGVDENGKYILLDEKRCVLRCSFVGKNVNEDDALLSVLVNVAPLRIVVHKKDLFSDKRILETIKDVFGQRVEFSEDRL